MKKLISSSIELDIFEKVDIDSILKKLEKFDPSIKSVSVFFTQQDERVKAIVEMRVVSSGGKKKMIIKKGIGASSPKALKKALKKAKQKLISIVIKRAQAA